MNKIWKFNKFKEDRMLFIKQQTGLSETISKILAIRNIDTPEKLDMFLYPSIYKLSDPFLLPNMKEVVAKLLHHIENNDVIVVYGDGDADGVTSSVIMTKCLQYFSDNVHTYIPSRREGYGLTNKGIDTCIERYKPDLLITVDTGINSNTNVQYANSKNVEVIITDHHEPDEEVARCLVVNPKIGSDENLMILCGAGVAFKIAHAMYITKEANGADKELENYLLHQLLPVCSIGTVADVVPLILDNRIMVKEGLVNLTYTPMKGVQALKSVCGVEGTPSTYDIGFKMAPRINAAGRISQPEEAFNLLMSDDKASATERAEKLNILNLERRRIEAESTNEYMVELEKVFDEEKTFGIIVANRTTHAGVAGIVASRIVGKYNRPSIVCSINNKGICKGSCRSVNEFNILGGLQHCSDLLISFGGHKGAAGLVFKLENLEALQYKFNEYVKSKMDIESLRPIVHVDAILQGADIGWDLYEELELLEPYGASNKEPIFGSLECRLENSKAIGKEKTHLKTSVITKDGSRFDGVMFNYDINTLPHGLVDVAYQLKINNWNGSLQLQLADIKVSNV